VDQTREKSTEEIALSILHGCGFGIRAAVRTAARSHMRRTGILHAILRFGAQKKAINILI